MDTHGKGTWQDTRERVRTEGNCRSDATAACIPQQCACCGGLAVCLRACLCLCMSAFLALKVGTELRSCSHIPLFTCCTALLPDALNKTLPAFQVCKDTDACCAALLTSTLANPRLPVRSLGALYTCCAALLPCALNTTLPACALLICCATLLSLILNTTLPACADFQRDALLYFWELPPTLNTSKWDVKGCAKVASTAQGTTCTTANTPQKQHQAREVYQECYEEWVRVRCTHRLTASPSCNADAVRATAHQQRTQGMLAPYTHFNIARAGQPHQQSCLCMRHAPSLMLGVHPPLHHAAAAL